MIKGADGRGRVSAQLGQRSRCTKPGTSLLINTFLSQRLVLRSSPSRLEHGVTHLKKERGSTTALFTGIVEEMGKVQKLEEVDGSVELTVEASLVVEDAKLGDSIAVNGTCLTVTSFDANSFVVGLSPETLRKTSLGEVKAGSSVNLERSLKPDSRMGGHFVQGHVDGTGNIASFQEEGDSLWVEIETSPDLLRYIVPKGYIAVDGTSLTVVDVSLEKNSFTFMLVAYTQQKIVVPLKKPGDKVNLEVDIVGKYVERMMQGYRIRAFQEEETTRVAKAGDWGSLQ